MGYFIGLAGHAKAGKDFTYSVMQNMYSDLNIRRFAFGDKVKECCNYVIKDCPSISSQDYAQKYYTQEGKAEYISKFGKTRRKLIQDCGNALRHQFHPDIWVLKCFEDIDLESTLLDPNTHIVVTDVRFPNECEYIQRNGGFVFRIDNDRIDLSDPLYEDESESHISSLPVDAVIQNHTTEGDLTAEIEKLFKLISINL